MVVLQPDLWRLIRSRSVIDATELAEAVTWETAKNELDYRTRLLIRDSLSALRFFWGEEAFSDWLAASSERVRLQTIQAEQFDEIGFPSLPGRLMDKLEPSVIQEYLRALSAALHEHVELLIGGSAALILQDKLSRATEDIDIVDEVPAVIREQHRLLAELERRYGLHLGHFQSHYLPSDWEKRLHGLEPIGRLQVRVLDVHDVFLSKLFSRREKDRDDLRDLAAQLEKSEIERRLRDHAGALRGDDQLHQNAKDNWYILYGEAFPT